MNKINILGAFCADKQISIIASELRMQKNPMQFDVFSSMELVKSFKLASITQTHSTINQIKPFSLLVAILSLIDLPI